MKFKKGEIDNYLKAKEISEALRDRVINDNCNRDDEIGKWLKENNSAKRVLHTLSEEDTLKQLYSQYDEINANKMEDAAKFANRIALSNRTVKYRRANIYKFSATIAAAVALISFLLFPVNDKKNLLSESEIPKAVPILILSDGKSIDLIESNDSAKIEEIATVDSKKAVLNYTALSASSTVVSEEIKYNTIIMPEMCNYTVVLEDSTEVLLNANSEFKYPTKFMGDKREVFLKGEAFFSVKKGTKPFIVSSYDVKVKVYGTRFNVNAYNPHVIKTALISGSVGVSVKGIHGEVLLKPNQMAVTDSDTKLNEVKDIESERYVAWTLGYFRYDSERLEDILDELSVWYNVKFIFDDSVKLYMTGLFEKTTSLENLLLSIEDATNVKFTKEKGGIYRVNYY